MTGRRRLWPLVLACLVGCTPSQGADPDGASGQQTTLRADVLFSDTYCGSAAVYPKVAWLGSTAALNQVFDRFDRSPGATPAVDFSRQAVLFIAMGQRPTAGYALDFANGRVQRQGETLEVRLGWREPPAGYRLAQVVTTPCLLIEIPAVSFSALRVVDQSGQVRLTGRR
ncbi:MAG: protease complex subunit PrcB family protein [Gammaproteobacteria bacterium]|nr:protease complex subunit PrcB family protein [Gammaproteobacteria bacterium]